MDDNGDLSRRVSEIEAWKGGFSNEVLQRMTRMETKMEAVDRIEQKVDAIARNGSAPSGGGGKSAIDKVVAALTYLIIGLVGVLTGRQIPQ